MAISHPALSLVGLIHAETLLQNSASGGPETQTWGNWTDAPAPPRPGPACSRVSLSWEERGVRDSHTRTAFPPSFPSPALGAARPSLGISQTFLWSQCC